VLAGKITLLALISNSCALAGSVVQNVQLDTTVSTVQNWHVVPVTALVGLAMYSARAHVEQSIFRLREYTMQGIKDQYATLHAIPYDVMLHQLF